MSAEKRRPVEDYLLTLPEPRRGVIRAIYRLARQLAPQASEGMKYAMPALVVDAQGLISAMSTKKHIGIYPYSGTVVHAFADQLAASGIACTKGAIQLPDGVALPDDLLAEIVTARLAEIAARTKPRH